MTITIDYGTQHKTDIILICRHVDFLLDNRSHLSKKASTYLDYINSETAQILKSAHAAGEIIDELTMMVGDEFGWKTMDRLIGKVTS